MTEFEIGPIRPPSESKSLLLRITRNCPWNKCKFCTLYKGQSFRTRPIEEIKADIDQIALYRDNIYKWISEAEASADSSASSISSIRKKIYALPEETRRGYIHILNWISHGEGTVFLQDANTMVLSFGKLREILLYLREKLPQATRVTSYGRVDSLLKFTVEELAELRETGLDRIHSGYESGSDKVLELIKKGYTKAQEIEAGQKVKAAGIELSLYFMPGAGGRELSDENAIETADVVNNVDPDFVRIRTFVPHLGTGIADDISAGFIEECTDKEKALELKKMIESLNGAEGHLYSDHIINLFEDVQGNMTTDKEKMLAIFTAFEKLGTREQQKYQVARRIGMVRSMSDYERRDREQDMVIDSYLSRLKTEKEFEDFLTDCLRRYI